MPVANIRNLSTAQPLKGKHIVGRSFNVKIVNRTPIQLDNNLVISEAVRREAKRSARFDDTTGSRPIRDKCTGHDPYRQQTLWVRVPRRSTAWSARPGNR
jgi:hypothetical protein